MWLSYRNTTCGWDGVTRSLAEFKISFELTRNATWNEKRQWLSLFRNRRIMWNIMITKGYGMVRLHGCATAFSSHSAPARSLSQRDHINSGRLEKLSKHRNPFESTNPNHQKSKIMNFSFASIIALIALFSEASAAGIPHCTFYCNHLQIWHWS